MAAMSLTAAMVSGILHRVGEAFETEDLSYEAGLVVRFVRNTVRELVLQELRALVPGLHVIPQHRCRGYT